MQHNRPAPLDEPSLKADENKNDLPHMLLPDALPVI